MNSVVSNRIIYCICGVGAGEVEIVRRGAYVQMKKKEMGRGPGGPFNRHNITQNK